jgi:DNA-binding transcriptional regulator YiaG
VKNKKAIPYDELGFRIFLLNAPMLTLPDGSKCVAPNMKKLQKTVFRELAKKPNRLSGSEVRFIRKYMRMTQGEFASWLNMANHSVVSQWESKGDHLSGIDYNTEILLRLLMEAQISKKSILLSNEIEKLRGLTSVEETITLNLKAS